MWCGDGLTGEIVAVVIFHIPDAPDRPIVMRCAIPRSDATSTSFGCLLLLKAVLHVLGQRLGRGDAVEFEPKNSKDADVALRSLGFRRRTQRRQGQDCLEQRLAEGEED
jgi:hypothetical protein